MGFCWGCLMEAKPGMPVSRYHSQEQGDLSLKCPLPKPCDSLVGTAVWPAVASVDQAAAVVARKQRKLCQV
jgi:hypothetical protein